jgi:hypothetical protein
MHCAHRLIWLQNHSVGLQVRRANGRISGVAGVGDYIKRTIVQGWPYRAERAASQHLLRFCVWLTESAFVVSTLFPTDDVAAQTATGRFASIF